MRRDVPTRFRLALVLVLATSIVVSACGGGGTQPAQEPPPGATETDAGDPVLGGSVVWGLEAETDGLNPVISRFAVSGHMLASAVFDPLVTIAPDGTWQPYLAESLTPNDDYTEWMLEVREGVTFHDGTPLDSAAVVKVMQLYQGSLLTGAAYADVGSVEAVGPYQVRVTMRAPWSSFPYVLTTQAGYVPAPAMLDDPTDTRTPIGTGPFRFEKWDHGRSFSATKNPDYWRTDDNGVRLPYLDRIEFRPLADPQSRTDALLAGDIDAMLTATPSEIARVRDEPGVETLSYDEGEESEVLLNLSKPPFDNLTARRALAHATDQEAIREAVGEEFAGEARGPWGPGQLGFTEDDSFPAHDLQEAQRLVQQYEAETGQRLSFTFSSPDDIANLQIQQVLARQWEAAGIQVTLQTVPQADLIVLVAVNNFQAALWRFFGHVDPDSEAVWLQSGSIGDFISLNFARISDPQLDAALMRARTSTDPAFRQEAYAEVTRILNQQVPFVWLFRVTWAIAARDALHGYGEASNGTIQTLGAKTWIAELWKG